MEKKTIEEIGDFIDFTKRININGVGNYTSLHKESLECLELLQDRKEKNDAFIHVTERNIRYIYTKLETYKTYFNRLKKANERENYNKSFSEGDKIKDLFDRLNDV